MSFALSPEGQEGFTDHGRQVKAAFRVSRLRLCRYRSALEDAPTLTGGARLRVPGQHLGPWLASHRDVALLEAEAYGHTFLE